MYFSTGETFLFLGILCTASDAVRGGRAAGRSTGIAIFSTTLRLIDRRRGALRGGDAVVPDPV